MSQIATEKGCRPNIDPSSASQVLFSSAPSKKTTQITIPYLRWRRFWETL